MASAPAVSAAGALRPSFEVRPTGCPRLVLALLTVSEVLTAMRSAGGKAADMEIRQECLRYALREVGEAKVRYLDLQGKRLHQHLPRPRHRNIAGIYWGRLHEPAPEERLAALNSVEVAVDSAEREQWTVALPDGRRITLAEVAEQTVAEALQQARRASTAAAFVELQTVLDALRRAVVAINGVEVSPEILAGVGWDERFSVKETLLLAAVFGEMQSGGEEALEAPIVPLAPASGASGT